MTAATLFTPGRAKLALSSKSNPAPSVSVALHELVTATRHLASALWAAASQAPVVEARAQTTTEQADQVRAMADLQMRFDMRFAQELYAMANRHEAAAHNA